MLEFLYGSLGGAIAEPPTYRSLDQLAEHNPRASSIARLSRDSMYLSHGGLGSRAHAIAVARSSQEQKALRAIGEKREQQHPKPPSEPQQPPDASQRLVRLRSALVAAPSRAKSLLLTPALLDALSKSPHHR